MPLSKERDADRELKKTHKVKIVMDKPRPFRMTIIEHDHLNDCEDVLAAIMHRSVFVMDEMHKVKNCAARNFCCICLTA